MKPKTMILLALAITCGLGASYMTSRLLAERQQPDSPESVEYLVAKQTIGVHTKIVKPEEVFEVKTVAKDQEPPDAIRDFEFLRGKTLKTGLNRGAHITPANLHGAGSGIEVPPGHQAIGIRVNLETTAHGLASLPGKRVDLQLTMRAQNPRDSKVKVWLENVLVLAADVETSADGKLAAPAQIVTFALPRKDILKANLGMELGTIRMIIRDPNDTSIAKKDELEISADEAIGNKQKAPEVEAPAKTVVQEVKPPEPKPEPEKPRFTKHHYDIVNGSSSGTRSVERVYYYRSTEDGRVLEAHEVEEMIAAQPPQPNDAPAADPKKSGGTN